MAGEFLQNALLPVSVPLSQFLGLPILPDYFPTILLWALFFWAVQFLCRYASPILSRSYVNLSQKSKHNWHVRFVSMVHVIIIYPLIFLAFRNEELEKDRAYGWAPIAGTISSVACGYFLWDTLESIIANADLPFILHGAACTAIFGLSFRPFLAYFAPRSLTWEISTVFLNIHWFLDKTGRTGGRLQAVNGVILILVFFTCRICYGAWASYELFRTLYSIREKEQTWVLAVYGTGNLLLNVLNWIWFAKLLSAIPKRFGGSKQNLPRLNKDD